MSILINEFSTRWFAEWEGDHPEFGPATEELNAMVREQPERAWERILGMIEVASEEQLNCVVAGPLEDLVCRSTESLFSRIEESARENSKVLEGLRSVWGWSRMNPELYQRLRALAPLHDGAK